MPTQIQGEITQLLGRIEAGDDSARARLIEKAYDELRSGAARLMRGERPGHTLQPTALVHEAAIRLMDDSSVGRGRSRAYFFWAMTRAMRQVLVDHARARRAERRGGDLQRVPLDDTIAEIETTQGVDLLELDEALSELEALNARMHEIVMLRFFGGLQISDVAAQLDVSESTVSKDWRFARAWLKNRMREAD